MAKIQVEWREDGKLWKMKTQSFLGMDKEGYFYFYSEIRGKIKCKMDIDKGKVYARQRPFRYAPWQEVGILEHHYGIIHAILDDWEKVLSPTK
jgi:hypothetical protein